jgi:hypothetical protein
VSWQTELTAWTVILGDDFVDNLQTCTIPMQVRQLEMERFSLAGSAGGDRAAADRLAALDAHLKELQDQQKARLLSSLYGMLVT